MDLRTAQNKLILNISGADYIEAVNVVIAAIQSGKFALVNPSNVIDKIESYWQTEGVDERYKSGLQHAELIFIKELARKDIEVTSN